MPENNWKHRLLKELSLAGAVFKFRWVLRNTKIMDRVQGCIIHLVIKSTCGDHTGLYFKHFLQLKYLNLEATCFLPSPFWNARSFTVNTGDQNKMLPDFNRFKEFAQQLKSGPATFQLLAPQLKLMREAVLSPPLLVARRLHGNSHTKLGQQLSIRQLGFDSNQCQMFQPRHNKMQREQLWRKLLIFSQFPMGLWTRHIFWDIASQ